MKVNAFRNAAALAFSVTFAGGVMAQSPTPQTPAPTPQATRPSPDTQPRQDSLKNMIGQTVTVSGCLAQEGSSGATTTTPAEPAAAGSNFVLTNVQMRSGAPTPGATTPSTSGTTPAPATGAGASSMKIKLKESATAKLGENLNKRVEVTGRLEAGASTSTARPGPTPGTPETGAPRTTGAAADAVPEMQVSSVRVLEQTCTAKQ
jgi:hypothetical protein